MFLILPWRKDVFHGMKWKAQTFSSFSSSAFSFFLFTVLLLSSSITRHQSLVPKTRSQVFFFLNELSITIALAGRHYASPMWRVGHVATSPPFFWFVIFFLIYLIWLLHFFSMGFSHFLYSIHTVKSNQYPQIYLLPLYCQCKCNCRLKNAQNIVYIYKKCTILYIFIWKCTML